VTRNWEEVPAGHEARMGLIRNVTTIWLDNLETRDQLGDPDMDWSITSKGDLQK
jgi:hypothetical protein